MSTNQERRAEARQRLREQMEAQARREKQLKIGAAAVVVVVLLGIVGIVVWNKAAQARAEEHAANWIACEYPEDTTSPQKADMAEYENESEQVKAEVRRHNQQVDEIPDTKRDGEAPTGDQPRRGTAQMTITTGKGDIPLEVDREGAPCNVASFIGLAEQGFFDDTECHRLTVPAEGMALAVLQCGDPTGTGLSGPGYSVVDEPPTNLAVTDNGSGMSIYPRGTIAMAKASAPNSAGSQFFLVYEDSTLPPEYSVMGTITEPGLEVLDTITDAGVKSNDQTSSDSQVPINTVEIEKVTVGAQEGLPEE